MIHFISGLLCIISATALYVKGETTTKWLGKSNKWFKTLIGIPIGIIYGLFFHMWLQGGLAALAYFVALQFGYGSSNWTVKLFSKRGALIFCGALMGIASAPILLWWSVLAAVISGAMFYLLDVLNNQIHEPWVAILRGIGGTICYL
jgi:hypothetical protein